MRAPLGREGARSSMRSIRAREGGFGRGRRAVAAAAEAEAAAAAAAAEARAASAAPPLPLPPSSPARTTRATRAATPPATAGPSFPLKIDAVSLTSEFWSNERAACEASGEGEEAEVTEARIRSTEATSAMVARSLASPAARDRRSQSSLTSGIVANSTAAAAAAAEAAAAEEEEGEDDDDSSSKLQQLSRAADPAPAAASGASAVADVRASDCAAAAHPAATSGLARGLPQAVGAERRATSQRPSPSSARSASIAAPGGAEGAEAETRPLGSERHSESIGSKAGYAAGDSSPRESRRRDSSETHCTLSIDDEPEVLEEEGELEFEFEFDPPAQTAGRNCMSEGACVAALPGGSRSTITPTRPKTWTVEVERRGSAVVGRGRKGQYFFLSLKKKKKRKELTVRVGVQQQRSSSRTTTSSSSERPRRGGKGRPAQRSKVLLNEIPVVDEGAQSARGRERDGCIAGVAAAAPARTSACERRDQRRVAPQPVFTRYLGDPGSDGEAGAAGEGRGDGPGEQGERARRCSRRRGGGSGGFGRQGRGSSGGGGCGGLEVAGEVRREPGREGDVVVKLVGGDGRRSRGCLLVESRLGQSSDSGTRRG